MTFHLPLVDEPQPHPGRARQLLEAHPEVRDLLGPNPRSALWVVALVAVQIAVAAGLSQAPWWLVVVAAWCFGAFMNHALYAMIHETTHHLIARGRLANQFWGIVANLPMAVPSAESFRVYHLEHHRHLGDYDYDLDLPDPWEVRLIGHSFLGKAVWLLGFVVFYSLRVFSRRRTMQFFTAGVVVNALVQFSFDAVVLWLFGPKALAYLFLGLAFGVGFHPIGARWIQEHWTLSPGQDTYDYIGPLNRLSFNVGYHNEHHDLPYVAWNRLPRLRALAPELYEPLLTHRSWTALWLRYLVDSRISLATRRARTTVVNAKTPPLAADFLARDDA